VDPWNRQGFVNKFALGKRSVGLDLSTPEARAAFERLVAAADVVIENYSPRVMPNLGLGEDRLRACNPHVVYVTMPGYGRTGPAKDYSAYGPVLDSHAGLSTLMGYPDVDAWKCGIAWPDPVAGIHAAFATLVALWVRDRDPQRAAATVEVAQFETAVSMIGDRIIRAQIDAADPPIIGNRHPLHAPHGVYRCAGDDRWLALCVSDDAAWASLCLAIEAPPSWPTWDLPLRRAEHDAIDATIAAWSARLDPHAAAAALQVLGVAAAPVADARDLVEDPHLAAAGFFTPLDHPSTGPIRWHRLPLRCSTIEARPRSAAPRLGTDNDAVLRAWAGLDSHEIDALIGQGVLGDIPPA
jgi:crotonobetainyl-CoA:carnitine CoA-transferase CaiB-like acyl-CoA transferase